MSVSLVKAYIGHEPVAPAAWLLENLGNRPTAYRWLGEGDPSDLSTLHFGLNDLTSEDYERNYAGTYYPSAPRFVEVPCVAWGDYCGGGVERANYGGLLEDLAAWGVREVSGGFGSRTLVLPAYAPVPLHTLESLRTLADEYPLWDEGAHSELETELAAKAWDDYGRWDLKRELETVIGDNDAALERLEELYDSAAAKPNDGGRPFDTAYWSALESENGQYPYLETAVSVVFDYSPAVLAAVRSALSL